MKVNLGFEVPVDVTFFEIGYLLEIQLRFGEEFSRKPSDTAFFGYSRKGNMIFLYYCDHDLAALVFPSKNLAKMYSDILKDRTARASVWRLLVNSYRSYLRKEFECLKKWEEAEYGIKNGGDGE